MNRKGIILVGVLSAGLVAAGVIFAMTQETGITLPENCPIPVPPIVLRVVGSSEELVFLTTYSNYFSAPGSPQARTSDLRYELAQYRLGDDHLGPGEVIRQGRLDSLNRTGDLQFHDMAAEGEFSPGNDFFILLPSPALTVQLRILDPTGKAIAWNMIVGCI